MRVDRGLLGWGVFLVIAGAVPLAVRSGYLSTDQIRNVGSLWPLILVGLGLGLILARTRLALLGGLVVATTFGLIVGGLLGGGAAGFAGGGCGPGAGANSFPAQVGTLGQTSGSVDIDLSCGNLDVRAGSGDAWKVEGEDGDGTGPIVDGIGNTLRIRSRQNEGGPLGMLGEHASWRVTLPETSRLDLDLTLNAGQSMIDLAGAAVSRVSVQLNAGSATMDLGSVREIEDIRIALNAGSIDLTLPNLSMTGSIEVNAGSVALCSPPGAALRLHTRESIVSGYDFEGEGLVKSGSSWESPGFSGAAVRIELDTQANAGSISLNPEDGCGG